ncbi:hypothetical protein [Dyadobacter sp. 3J3]|uniref:hypothetical protein n=1 Tax=Dyadobacter sp. 3J3 TaxID=2606600 RepID=UPI00135B1A98|nr:hypothetical protein [Dyadobacter sp. 3J3]
MKSLRFFMAFTALSLMLFAGCKDVVDHPVNPVNPDLAEVVPTSCTNPPIRSWLFAQFAIWGQGPTLIYASEELQLSNLAIFHALYFENSSENQYYGVKGEYTDQINKSLKDLKNFWDIEAKNIVTVAAHGSMLQDRGKVIKMYTKIYGYSNEKANKYADSLATLFKIYPQYSNGDHPAFTFNQLAIPDTLFANVGQVPAKIIIGDGSLQGFDTLGYGKTAPQSILAHEVGHLIQYDLGILKPGMKLTPKTSRRFELMADAYAAYFLAHTRGAAMQLNELQQVAEVFFNTGDCEFTIDGHHGTPTQRKAATEWGYNLARNADNKDHIIGSREFASLFDAVLNDIIKK